MKILYIINRMTNLAGIERILTCKMNYLTENTNHQIILSTYEQQGRPLSFQQNDNILYRPISAPITIREGSSIIEWLKAYYHARKVFRREFDHLINDVRPDLIICTVYSFMVLDIIINTAHKGGAKTILESHTKGDTVTIAYKYSYNRLLYRLFSLWDKYIMCSLKKCNCVVTLTKHDKAYWQHYAQRIEVIPNMLTIIPKRVLNYKAKRVISAGRYMYEKGFDRLLDAWHLLSDEYNDWHLYIFGNEDRTPYQYIVDKYNMNERVHLMLATNDIAEEFSKSSIYVMSSRYEGFGLVLAEAMSCGLPCISFDCPYGPREIIRNGEDGFLLEDGDVKVLARTIEYLMSDVVLRQTMGEKAIKNIARYEPDFIMKCWVRLFERL